VTRPCLQLLTTKIKNATPKPKSVLSSIQPSDCSFCQYSSLNVASTSNSTVTAAHCPEVLWYDEVGGVSNRHTHTHAGLQAQHFIYTQTHSKSDCGSLEVHEATRRLLVWSPEIREEKWVTNPQHFPLHWNCTNVKEVRAGNFPPLISVENKTKKVNTHVWAVKCICNASFSSLWYNRPGICTLNLLSRSLTHTHTHTHTHVHTYKGSEATLSNSHCLD